MNVWRQLRSVACCPRATTRDEQARVDCIEQNTQENHRSGRFMQYCTTSRIEATRHCREGAAAERRNRFVGTARDYARDADKSTQCLKLATLIDASRAVARDDSLLPGDIVAVLTRIREKYRLLVSPESQLPPRNYREARMLLAELFF